MFLESELIESTFVESKYIYYREGYKYQTDRTLYINTGIKGYEARTEYICLFKSGWLVIAKGYAYDGASGPTVDTKSSMRCSAAHDALYQLARLGFLPLDLQDEFDALLVRLGKEDNMWWIRAHIWERMLCWFGRPNMLPKNDRKLMRAP